jgi:hypothetical protein
MRLVDRFLLVTARSPRVRARLAYRLLRSIVAVERAPTRR